MLLQLRQDTDVNAVMGRRTWEILSRQEQCVITFLIPDIIEFLPAALAAWSRDGLECCCGSCGSLGTFSFWYECSNLGPALFLISLHGKPQSSFRNCQTYKNFRILIIFLVFRIFNIFSIFQIFRNFQIFKIIQFVRSLSEVFRCAYIPFNFT